MKKIDLENRMVVELRSGFKGIVCGDFVMSNNQHLRLTFIRENLESIFTLSTDIVKVYDKVKVLNDIETAELIWERKEKVVYTEEEKDILKGLDLLGFEAVERKKANFLYAYSYNKCNIYKLDNKLFKDIKITQSKSIKEMLEEGDN